MPKSKLLLSLWIGLAVIFAQVGVVQAAAPRQDGAFITGTVQGIVIETNPETAISTVVVSLLVNGAPQTVRLSVETAAGLWLILVDDNGNPILDENGLPIADTSWIGWDVDIDPATILPDDIPTEPPAEEEPEEPQHPVGAKIAGFFSNLFDDVDYDVVMSAHADGFGFGVITQALWMTQKLGGNAELFQTILTAKENHDYFLVTLPDGSIPQNWGQLKKVLLQGEADENLGEIVSGAGGKQENSRNGKPDDVGTVNNGNGMPENPGNGNGKPENPGNGNSNRQGNGNGKSNRPETPPGQNKANNENGKTK